jgi:hypothetical protein
MVNQQEPQAERPAGSPPRRPRMSDLFDVTEDMIAFADKYAQVWEQEARATLALGEFLTARSASMRSQVDLMRMGSDAFGRYNAWSEAVFGVRPDALMRGVVDQIDRLRPRRRDDSGDAP